MPEWVDPINDPRWEEEVLRVGGSVFHSPPWLDVLSRTYGFEMTALLGDDGGGIAFARLAGPERLVSLPFSDYSGPMTNDPATWASLSEALLETGLPVRMRTLADADLVTGGGAFARSSRAHWHGIEVAGTPDEMWANIRRHGRTAVRKAENAGVVVRKATDEADLRAFHSLQLGVRKNKYRLLAQPYRFFQEIWSAFMEQGRGALRLAEVDGRIIAGALFLEWGGVWAYKFNASALDAVDLRPNDALLWNSIVDAADAGIGMICLGLTDWDQDGLVRFKEKYAAANGVISTFTAGPEGDVPAWKRRSSSLATRAATHPAVPDSVTDWVGARIYRTFA